MTGDNDKNKKGFAGLADLASDISSINKPINPAPKPPAQLSALKPPAQPTGLKLPVQPSVPKTFLCKTCSFHLNNSCNLNQRPYAITCNLYCQSLSSQSQRRSLELQFEIFFRSLAQQNFLAKQWNRAVKLIPQRIQLALQTVPKPSHLPLQLKILSSAGAIGLIWCAFLFSVREVKPVRKVSPLDPFKTLISEYSKASGLKNPAKSKRPRTKPYIKGKIFPVEINGKGKWIASDLFYPALPKNLRATSPANAGTIVLLKWGADFGACNVIIIDKSLKIIVAEKNFRHAAAAPFKKIVDYLRSLPKKLAINFLAKN